MGGGMIPRYYIINLDIINYLKLYKPNLIMNRLFPFYLLVILILSGCTSPENTNKLKFSISYSEGLSETALDGRLLLMISNNDEAEPRFQIRDDGKTQLIYGIDVENMKSGDEVLIDGSVFGFPIHSLNDIPAREYYVQALLHTYETFNLSTGHTVKLPNDNGEGQHWNRSPGNILSTPIKLSIDPSQNITLVIVMDQKIPPIEEPEDTKYIRHVKMQSDLLTKFWGRPMYLGAHILVPEGFDEHLEAKYPLIINHGHFPANFGGFRTEFADPNLEPDYSERFSLAGYNRIQQEEAYNFYRTWTSDNFPRFLIIKIQHQNPYYDDSYAVNSANIGYWPLWRCDHLRACSLYRGTISRYWRRVVKIFIWWINRRLGGIGSTGFLSG